MMSRCSPTKVIACSTSNRRNAWCAGIRESRQTKRGPVSGSPERMSMAGTNPDWPDFNRASGTFPLRAGGASKDGPEPAARGRHFQAVFSRRTPLNFLAALFFVAGLFTALNSPVVLLRLDLGRVFHLAHFIREAPPEASS